MKGCRNCARLAESNATLRDKIHELSPTFPPVYGLSFTQRELLGYLLKHINARLTGLMAAGDLTSPGSLKTHMCHLRAWLTPLGFNVYCEPKAFYVIGPKARARDFLARLQANDESLLDEIKRVIGATPGLREKLPALRSTPRVSA